MKPLISVIVPAHNEEKYLGATLEALRQQTYPYFEILVVANGCEDNTAEAARHRCDRLIELRDKSLGRARNTGAAKARGELLIFLDADTQLEPRALEAIAQEFTKECSAGTLKGKPDTRKAVYSLFYFFKNSLHRTALHCGSSGVICCWRDQFKEAGGFQESLEVRENSELIRRLQTLGRYKFISSASAVTSMRRFEARGFAAVWDWFKIWFESLVSDLRGRRYETVR